jgi:hypothetical protein
MNSITFIFQRIKLQEDRNRRKIKMGGKKKGQKMLETNFSLGKRIAY